MVPQLMDMFPHLVAVMERNFEHLSTVMKIIESYILLGKVEFLRSHGAGVAKILDIVVGNVKEKGMMCTLPVIDALVQVCQFLGDLTLLVHLSLLCNLTFL
jgi:hypothetical protein